MLYTKKRAAGDGERLSSHFVEDPKLVDRDQRCAYV
jgi:hypothetical protein